MIRFIETTLADLKIFDEICVKLNKHICLWHALMLRTNSSCADKDICYNHSVPTNWLFVFI